MADARATIVVEARDEASAQIQSVTGAVNDLNATMRESKDTAEKSTETNKQSNISWTDMAAQLYLVKNAVSTVVGAFNQLTAETIALSDEQRNLATISGTTVEEAGKLILSADEMQVSYGTLEAASRKMVLNGLSPSIDNMKKLADQYNAIQDPVARSQMLLDNFGRSGLEMGKFLSQGSEGIQAAADNATELGVVLSGDAVKSMRNYEIAVNESKDAILGLKNAIVIDLIPSVTDWINLTLKSVSVQNQLTAAFKQGIITGQESGTISTAMRNGAMSVADAQTYLNTATLQYVSTQTIAIAALTNWVDESDRGIAVTTSLANGIKQQLAQSLADAKTKADDLRTAFSNLSLELSGPLKTEDDNFKARQGELQAKIDESKAKIGTLLSQGYSPMGKTIQGVNADLTKQQTDLETNAAKHEEATRRIVFGLMQQKLQADITSGAITGDTALGAEAALNKIGVSWGVLDQKTATAASSIDSALDKLAHGGNLDDFENALYRVGGVATDAYVKGHTAMITKTNELDNGLKVGIIPSGQKLETVLKTDLPTAADATIKSMGLLGDQWQTEVSTGGNLNTYRIEMQGLGHDIWYAADQVRNFPGFPSPYGNQLPGSETGTGYAMGVTDFVVPPGYLNDSYIVRVQTGEHVTVTPQGQRDPSGRGAAAVNINGPIINNNVDIEILARRVAEYMTAAA